MTLWTETPQAPLSIGLFKQEYRRGLSFPSPGGLLNPGIECAPPAWQADSLPAEPSGKYFACSSVHVSVRTSKEQAFTVHIL